MPRIPANAGRPGAAQALDAAALRFGLYAGLLLPVAFGLVFARQLLEFRDPFVSWTEDAALLLGGTQWGTTYLMGAALALLTPVAFGIGRVRRGLGWALATVSVLSLCFFPALTGHANAGEGWRRFIMLSADVAHVWAAGAWMGGLAGVLFIDWAVRDRDVQGSAWVLPALVPVFSPVAMAAVATLVGTGVLASWVHLSDLRSLIDAIYGRTLSIKLAAVGAVLFLGWLNWRRHLPGLSRTAGADRMRKAAVIELAFAQLVLLATAVLVRTSPPQ